MRGFTHNWHSLCPSPWHRAPGRGYWDMNINSPSAQVRARSQGQLFVEELHVKYYRCNTLQIQYYFIWSIKGMARPLGSHCYPQGRWASHQRANAHQYKGFSSHRSWAFFWLSLTEDAASAVHLRVMYFSTEDLLWFSKLDLSTTYTSLSWCEKYRFQGPTPDPMIRMSWVCSGNPHLISYIPKSTKVWEAPRQSEVRSGK